MLYSKVLVWIKFSTYVNLRIGERCRYANILGCNIPIAASISPVIIFSIPWSRIRFKIIDLFFNSFREYLYTRLPSLLPSVLLHVRFFYLTSFDSLGCRHFSENFILTKPLRRQSSDPCDKSNDFQVCTRRTLVEWKRLVVLKSQSLKRCLEV